MKHILDSGYSESSLDNDGQNYPINRIEDEAGIDIGTTETQPVLEDQSVSASTVHRRAAKRLERKIEDYMDNLNLQKVGRTETCVHAAPCDDMAFFQSLLPIVQTLPLHQKMLLRMDMMKLAVEYSEKNYQVPQSPQVKQHQQLHKIPQQHFNTPPVLPIAPPTTGYYGQSGHQPFSQQPYNQRSPSVTKSPDINPGALNSGLASPSSNHTSASGFSEQESSDIYSEQDFEA